MNKYHVCLSKSVKWLGVNFTPVSQHFAFITSFWVSLPRGIGLFTLLSFISRFAFKAKPKILSRHARPFQTWKQQQQKTTSKLFSWLNTLTSNLAAEDYSPCAKGVYVSVPPILQSGCLLSWNLESFMKNSIQMTSLSQSYPWWYQTELISSTFLFHPWCSKCNKSLTKHVY